jgi:hypothetical protein
VLLLGLESVVRESLALADTHEHTQTIGLDAGRMSKGVRARDMTMISPSDIGSRHPQRSSRLGLLMKGQTGALELQTV